MKKVCTAGFNRAQFILSRAVVSELTGSRALICCADACEASAQNCDLVVLQSGLSEVRTEQEFSVLENAGCRILVVSQYVPHPYFIRRYLEYEKSSLLVYPLNEAELTDCGNEIRNGGRYVSIAARSASKLPENAFLPQLGSLSATERTVLFSIARGDSVKEAADRLSITRHSVETFRNRVRRLFGPGVSDADIIEKLTWLF
jgi:DNA-binding CsgD family transcriptional regulator